MTKEYLLKKIDTWGVDHIAITGIKDCVGQFFESNVCIPRGENPHPYADVWHAYVEDTTQTLQYRIKSESKWYNSNGILNFEYRIKPSEPVYEYLWYKFVNGHIDSTGDWEVQQYFTESEMNDSFKKYEETKRVRNA